MIPFVQRFVPLTYSSSSYSYPGNASAMIVFIGFLSASVRGRAPFFVLVIRYSWSASCMITSLGRILPSPPPQASHNGGQHRRRTIFFLPVTSFVFIFDVTATSGRRRAEGLPGDTAARARRVLNRSRLSMADKEREQGGSPAIRGLGRTYRVVFEHAHGR